MREENDDTSACPVHRVRRLSHPVEATMINYDSLSDDKLNEEIAARKGERLGHYAPIPETDARFSSTGVYLWVSYDYLHDGAATWEALNELPNLSIMRGRDIHLETTWQISSRYHCVNINFSGEADLARGIWLSWLMWKELQAERRLTQEKEST